MKLRPVSCCEAPRIALEREAVAVRDGTPLFAGVCVACGRQGRFAGWAAGDASVPKGTLRRLGEDPLFG